MLLMLLHLLFVLLLQLLLVLGMRLRVVVSVRRIKRGHKRLLSILLLLLELLLMLVNVLGILMARHRLQRGGSHRLIGGRHERRINGCACRGAEVGRVGRDRRQTYREHLLMRQMCRKGLRSLRRYVRGHALPFRRGLTGFQLNRRGRTHHRAVKAGQPFLSAEHRDDLLSLSSMHRQSARLTPSGIVKLPPKSPSPSSSLASHVSRPSASPPIPSETMLAFAPVGVFVPLMPS